MLLADMLMFSDIDENSVIAQLNPEAFLIHYVKNKENKSALKKLFMQIVSLNKILSNKESSHHEEPQTISIVKVDSKVQVTNNSTQTDPSLLKAKSIHVGV